MTTVTHIITASSKARHNFVFIVAAGTVYGYRKRFNSQAKALAEAEELAAYIQAGGKCNHPERWSKVEDTASFKANMKRVITIY